MNEVLSLVQCTNLGGMEQSTYYVLNGLSDEFRFHIATPQLFGPGYPLLQSADKHALDCEYQGKFGWRSQRNFNSIVDTKLNRASCIWITGTDMACLRAARRTDLPILLGNHYHHFEHRFSKLNFRLFYELMIRDSVHLTFNTDFIRNEAISICHWIKNQSTVVRYHFEVHNVSKDERAMAKQALGFDPDTFVIGNAGWLVRRKRWDVFLRVISALKGERTKIRALICGGGPEENALRAMSVELGIEEMVTFCGWQSDLGDFYKAMDVLLFNSDFDALGRTPGEAMGFGVVPVASVRYGGLAELLHDGVNGRLIRNHDVEELADAVRQLMLNEPQRVEYQEAGKEILQRKYSSEAALSFYRNYFSGSA